ncbi:MAG: class I SAM-dependent methyltransferase [Caldimonas sp.]
MLLAAAVAMLAGRRAVAEAPTRYDVGPASPDGIGKRYFGREISQVMGWQGAAWLEREERDREERTDLLVAALKLRPGDVVADIGAGTGYISRRLATAVGPRGRVDAVDVQPEMVRLLSDLASKAGLAQIRPSLGTATDVRLAAASVDLALMVDVYHELEFPFEVLTSVVRAVKPGGRVVFVEYRAEDAAVPIKPLHKMSVAQVRREAALHPLVFNQVIDILPWQHIVEFRKR